MISIIIPTMWRAPDIDVMLPLLNDHPLVGEIFLIDNEPRHAHQHRTVCGLNKLAYYTEYENIFPVRSWNIGAARAVYDKLVIINDDVMFSLAVIDAIHDHINEDRGTITFYDRDVRSVTNSIYDIDPRRKTPEEIEVKYCPKLKYKAATLLAIHRSNYVPIPEELKIYFNDTFLFAMCLKNGKENLSIHGMDASTNMSRTSSLFNDITKKEEALYGKIFKEYGIK